MDIEGPCVRHSLRLIYLTTVLFIFAPVAILPFAKECRSYLYGLLSYDMCYTVFMMTLAYKMRRKQPFRSRGFFILAASGVAGFILRAWNVVEYIYGRTSWWCGMDPFVSGVIQPLLGIPFLFVALRLYIIFTPRRIAHSLDEYEDGLNVPVPKSGESASHNNDTPLLDEQLPFVEQSAHNNNNRVPHHLSQFHPPLPPDLRGRGDTNHVLDYKIEGINGYEPHSFTPAHRGSFLNTSAHNLLHENNNITGIYRQQQAIKAANQSTFFLQSAGSSYRASRSIGGASPTSSPGRNFHVNAEFLSKFDLKSHNHDNNNNNNRDKLETLSGFNRTGNTPGYHHQQHGLEAQGGGGERDAVRVAGLDGTVENSPVSPFSRAYGGESIPTALAIPESRRGTERWHRPNGVASSPHHDHAGVAATLRPRYEAESPRRRPVDSHHYRCLKEGSIVVWLLLTEAVLVGVVIFAARYHIVFVQTNPACHWGGIDSVLACTIFHGVMMFLDFGMAFAIWHVWSDFSIRRELCILGIFHLILAGRSALSLIFNNYPTGESGVWIDYAQTCVVLLVSIIHPLTQALRWSDDGYYDPASEATLRTLASVLRDPNGFDAFSKYAHDVGGGEWLELWIRIELFRDIPDERKSDRTHTAQDLFALLFPHWVITHENNEEGGNCSLQEIAEKRLWGQHLDPKIPDDIHERLAMASKHHDLSVPVGLFDEVQEKLYQHMERVLFHDFQESPEYQRLRAKASSQRTIRRNLLSQDMMTGRSSSARESYSHTVGDLSQPV